jgi:RND superfamily putative drug exporter
LAWLLIGARWLVLLGWVAIAVLAVVRLPALSPTSGALGDITSIDNPALATEQRSAKEFGLPLLTRTAMVQHDPEGLPDSVLRNAARRAADVTEDTDRAPVAAAFPVPGHERIPGVRRPGTTIVTYLYPKPDQNLQESLDGARSYAAGFDATERVIGVTGTVPARLEQQRIINSSLPLLEGVSLGAVLLIVGLAFRSLIAPLLTLGAAGLSFLMVSRVSGWLAERHGLHVPADLEPLMVALMLGVTTDYVVYFLSGMRAELRDGHGRVESARRATATFAPIVVVAGVTVAAGVATLLLGRSPAVRAFGPAMAISVVAAMLVSVTAVPAAMAILGRLAFWPSRSGVDPSRSDGGAVRRGVVRVLRHRVGAVLVAASCLAGLVAAAWPAGDLRTGLPFVAALPQDTEASRADRAASDGFVPGIVSPTLVEIYPRAVSGVPGPGTAASSTATPLSRLQDLLSRRPHVAGVIGPREESIARQALGRDVGVFVTSDGTAARFLVVLDVDPLDAVAVDAVENLRVALPGLLDEAGLTASTRYGLGGDTAAVAAVIAETDRDLRRVLIAALLVNLAILIVFLRSLIAPVFLMVSTILSVAATLGVTVLMFQDTLRHPGLTFFVPMATAVLLIALGSDYNLFAVGHVWEEARRRRLRDAMLAALPRSSAAITTAGFALAASMGALALVPLRQSREMAFTLVVGILIDVLLVRTLLAPALLGLFGRLSGWPGRRLAEPPPPPEAGAKTAP